MQFLHEVFCACLHGLLHLQEYKKAPDDAKSLFNNYKDFGKALLSAYLVIFGNEDPRRAMQTDWPEVGSWVVPRLVPVLMKRPLPLPWNSHAGLSLGSDPTIMLPCDNPILAWPHVTATLAPCADRHHPAVRVQLHDHRGAAQHAGHADGRSVPAGGCWLRLCDGQSAAACLGS